VIHPAARHDLLESFIILDTLSATGASAGAVSTPTLTDWIGAGAAILTLIVALVALRFAKNQIAEAQTARALTAELDEARTQPYVVMFTRPSKATEVIVDIVIRNFGQTAAYNVTVDLAPWPERTGRSSQEGAERIRFPENIPVLAPGQEWRTMWDSGLARKDSTLPERHVGTLTYQGIRKQQFESAVILDWGVYKTRQWVEVRTMHDAAKALREINSTMKKWNEGVRGSLSVYVRDGDARDRHNEEEMREWRESAAKEDAGSGNESDKD
jgi:hypothetical protein